MRGLSPEFIQNLQTGFLAGLRQKVLEDQDLNLEIREDYLNIYYKGNSLLKLTEQRHSRRYQVYLDKKFWENLSPVAYLVDEKTTQEFLAQIPAVKENIIQHGKLSLEVEYEQLIIRANNQERRNNSEYFIIDRQYVIPEGRFDLIGFYWGRSRRRGQTVPLCLIEVKFALNTDIREVHQQLERYYGAIKLRAKEMVAEFQTIFEQKLELGLFNQLGQVEALKTLKFSDDYQQFQFVLILVDYNRYSSLLELNNLRQLEFANQIKVFWTGFAIWDQNLEKISA
jgi:hypothetical protein